jgi:hypothetical protein
MSLAFSLRHLPSNLGDFNMDKINSGDTRLSLPAIVVGALTAFVVNLSLMSLSNALAMVLFHIETGQNISSVGYATTTILAIFRALVAFTIGGYLAGYFSPQGNLFESRLHGFAAFALAGVLTAFYLTTNGAIGFRNVFNTASSYVVPVNGAPSNFNSQTVTTNLAPTRVIFGGIPIRPPSASSILLGVVLSTEGAAVAFWAGGEAYLRRRRRNLKGIAREESRAA